MYLKEWMRKNEKRKVMRRFVSSSSMTAVPANCLTFVDMWWDDLCDDLRDDLCDDLCDDLYDDLCDDLWWFCVMICVALLLCDWLHKALSACLHSLLRLLSGPCDHRGWIVVTDKSAPTVHVLLSVMGHRCWAAVGWSGLGCDMMWYDTYDVM